MSAKWRDKLASLFRRKRLSDITPPRVHDLLVWRDPRGMAESHTWRVLGCHYGAVGQESVIHVENVSHKPGWTGPWENHVMMFIPACLLHQCEIIRKARP